MKQTQIFIPTEKETPRNAVAKSHIYMLRGGFIRQIAGGIYAYLPLAFRIIRKIEEIIRKNLDTINAAEVMMPEMIPAELWKQSSRYFTYGPEMYKLKDRQQREFIMGPTHEETFAKVISDEIKSYKKLPLILYQIRDKFRDELRPKNGLIRAREFIMQDAYSFSLTEKGLNDAYKKIEKAYKEIFDQIGVKYKEIIADSGTMGGKDSTEFQAISNTGDDIIVYSDKSSYAANLDKATDFFQKKHPTGEMKKLSIIDTPNLETVAEDAKFLKVPSHKIAKTIVFVAKDKIIAVTVPGDYEANSVKVKSFLNIQRIKKADRWVTYKFFGAHFGSIGPLDLKNKNKIILLIDRKLENEFNWFVGANQDGKHFANFNPKRDLSSYQVGDFVTTKRGDLSPDGRGRLKFTRGIEIGHIFKLGTFYSKKMGAQVQDTKGKLTDIIMGSYGIGISRLLSAVAEQFNDDKGFIWPKSVAPFQVHLLVMDSKNSTQMKLANELEKNLEKFNYETLFDDRNERPGVKLADADLIGIPIRIIVGRNARKKLVEIKMRSEEKSQNISTDFVLQYVKNKLS